jgi:pimeloyl-ACP methyl ester carboxylesterase
VARPREELNVEERGVGAHRVVFVHGVLDRGRSFGRVAALLDDECHMTWYDRRGYGDSLGAPGVPVGVDTHIADLVDVLDGRRAVVVGHSFGGVSALGAALAVPELVDAVVIYETGMAWAAGWDDSRMRAMLWGEQPESAAVRMMLGERLDRMAPEEQASWLAQSRAFVAEERSVRTGTPPFDLAALAVPLVYGSDRNPMADVVESYLSATVPGVEVVRLAGAGHNAHRSQPAGFADLVRRGIRRGTAAGAG